MCLKNPSSRSPYTIKKCTPTTSKSSANLLCLCKTNNSRKRYLRANSSLRPISVFRPLYAARSKSHHRHVLSVCNRQWTLKANHLDPNPTSQLARWRGFGYPNISFHPLLLTIRKLTFTRQRYFHIPSMTTSMLGREGERRAPHARSSLHGTCKQQTEHTKPGVTAN